MKIALIGQKGIPATYGGVERHVHDLAVRLVQAGHTVTVYSRFWYTKTRTSNFDGVKVKLLPSLHTKHLDTISHTLLATIHALFGGYDVIHFHGVGPALLSWLPRIFAPRAKVITTFHSIDRLHQKWGCLARIWLRLGEWSACTFAHETITISPSLQEYCRQEFNKVTNYIPNAVNLPMLSIAPNNEIIEQFGLTKNNYILAVGRLIPCKAMHILIEAFTALKRLHTNDPTIAPLKLVVVGGSVYTDDYVRQLHQQASVCNDIIFTDFQSGETLGALYRHATFFVQPSLVEGLPLAVLEAMSYGKIVLASRIPEHMQLITDERVLFESNNVSDLQQVLYDYTQLNHDEKTGIEKHNYNLVAEDYSWDAMAPQIIALYSRRKTDDVVAPVKVNI